MIELYCFIDYLDEDKEKTIEIIEKEIIKELSKARDRMLKFTNNYDNIIKKLNNKNEDKYDKWII